MKKTLFHVFICCFLLFPFLQAIAQTRQPPGNKISQMTAGGTLDSLYDRLGNVYTFNQIAIDSALHNWNNTQPSSFVTSTCNSGYFKLYLDQGCGMEDPTNPLHVARLAVVCQVLSDISAFINSPCANGQVNVWVKNISTIGGATGALGVASSFYNVPSQSTASGIVDNTTWITLHSGTNAYANTTLPITTLGSGSSGNFFHCYMAFNFTQPWNLSLTSGPSSGDYDFYSVVLHEMMHALGFNSLIDGNGQSLIGTNRKYYSRYDMNLKNSSGVPLISQIPGSCGIYGYNFSASLSDLQPNPSTPVPDYTNCTAAIRYWGSLATPQPVYTPNAWTAGSSLSHMEDMCPPAGSSSVNNLYFLMSNALNPGSAKRYPKPEERQVLCDIGYNCNTTFGSSSNTSFNYTYTGGSCPGIGVAGINDGISNGQFIFNCTPGGSVTIHGSDILSNDHGVTGGSYECVEAIAQMTQGLITGSTSGTASSTFTFTALPTASGIQLLRYIPVSSSGALGNITYIYVFVNTNASCTYTSCNLLPNGDFEGAQNCGALYANIYNPPPVINCWLPVFGTPDLYSAGCATGSLSTWSYNIPTNITRIPYYFDPTSQHVGTTTANNQHFMGLWGAEYGGGTYMGEGMQVPLGTSLIPGNSYTVSFWAKVANTYNLGSGLQYLPSTITFSTSSGQTVPYSYSMSALPSNVTDQISFTIPTISTPTPAINGIDQNWTYFTQSFTYAGTANADYFIVYNNINNVIPGVSYPSGGFYGTYVFIDDITLQATSLIPTFALPSTASTCASPLTNLSQYLTPYVSGGTFSGPGVNNATQTFDPANAGGPGTKYLTYTYTNSLGCTETATGSINVQGPITISAALNPVCSGQSNTLTATGCSNCVWSPATVTCQNAACSVVTTTQTANTTYTVYDAANTSCTARATVNMFSADILGLSNNICTTGFEYLYATPNIPGGSYAWYSYANGTGTYINGSNASAFLTFSSTTPGTYQLYVVINNGTCSATSPIHTYTVTAPATVTTTTPSVTTCFPACATLNATVSPSGSYSYNWYENGNFLITTTSPTYSACTTGTYSLLVADPASSCITTPISFTANITQLPVSIIAVGSATGCASSGVTLTSLPARSTGITYQWFNNNVAIAGATSATYQAYTSGTYSLQILDYNGCGGTSNSVAVTINAAPTVSVSPASATSLCAQNFTSTIAVPSGYTPGTYSYQWVQNGTPTTNVGTNSSSYTASTTGQYYIQVTDATNNCTFQSTAASMTITPPPTPTQTGSLCNSGVTLSISPVTGYTYQWYRGVPPSVTNITGATGTSCTAAIPGAYGVQLTSGLCSIYSNSIGVATPVTTSVAINPAPVAFYCDAGVTLTAVPSPTSTYTYQWYNNGIAISGGTTSTYNASTAGNYTVTITRSGYCSSTSAPTSVSHASGSNGACAPCWVFGGGSTTTISGAITNQSYNGNVYISDDITINGTVNFGIYSSSTSSYAPAFVLVEPGKKITIASGATLNIDSSHLEACGATWNGIIMNGNSTLNVGFGSLIENATTAISSNGINTINCNAAIFNQDKTAIFINNYTGNGNNLVIKNSVFTNSIVVIGGSISLWRNIATLRSMYSPADVSFSAPYNIANPANSTYYGSTGSNTMAALTGTTAIALNNVNNITIGDNTPGNMNLFVNYQNGIVSGYTAAGSGNTLTLNNNTFANMTVDGVFAKNMGVPSALSLTVVPGANNQFYNCGSSCVEAIGYNNISGQGARMTGTHTTATPNSNLYGYNITTGTYNSINISNNVILNVGTGIAEKGLAGFIPKLNSTYSPTANITINGNTIQSDPAVGNQTNPSTNRFVQTGIYLSTASGNPLYLVGYSGLVTVSNNTLWDVYNGISANGYNPQTLYVSNNANLRLYKKPGTPVGQYGIAQYACNYSTISGNIVTCSSLANSQDSMRGIYSASSTGTNIGCNETYETGRGIEFANTPPPLTLKWYPGNSMKDNYKGLVINTNGIGQQGTLVAQPGISTVMDNQWLGSNWTNTLPAHNPIYTIGNATTAASKLVCNSSLAIYYPTLYNASNAGAIYTANNGLLPCQTNCANPSCPKVSGGSGIGIGGGTGVSYSSTQSYQVADMEQVAQDGVTYSNNQTVSAWMAQNALYRALQVRVVYDDYSDDTAQVTTSYESLTDSSMILNSFYSLAQNSRYSYLTNIEQAIALDTLDYARYLIANIPAGNVYGDPAWGVTVEDNSDADYVVGNYLSYYTIAANFTDSTMSGTDSSNLMALANMCPLTNGDAVYKARALYNIVYNDAAVWNDDSLCTMVSDGGDQQQQRMARAGTIPITAAQQAYKLVPNPNDGHMGLLQTVKDGNPVHAEVYNAIGQTILSTQLQFSDRQARLDVGVVPGMYLLKLQDSDGKSYVLKFVVN
ncbi:MAG: hypothetical protein P4L41_00550 [Flavipsychrobacter sp.]|nr:hypothetical protein [Flavipsychrobacter sp.]